MTSKTQRRADLCELTDILTDNLAFKPPLVIRCPVPVAEGFEHDLTIKYDPRSGRLSVKCQEAGHDRVKILTWLHYLVEDRS